MTTFAIGDIQGCLLELIELLNHIQFNPKEDELWFVGDLVNRGPQSLEVLRFIKALGPKHHVVLGNHDLHLLALAYGSKTPNPTDTLNAILKADDKVELIEWLRHRPLLHFDHAKGYAMVHAGIAPYWTISQALVLAGEVESILRSNAPHVFFKSMYGTQEDIWHENLSGMERLRCITNYLTRMRFCHPDGRLDLIRKDARKNLDMHLLPWFTLPNRANSDVKIIFGHWASLNGVTNIKNVFAIDTGCGEGKGNKLTALRLEDEKIFSIVCK